MSIKTHEAAQTDFEEVHLSIEDIQEKLHQEGADYSPREGLNIFNNELINPSETGPVGSGDPSELHDTSAQMKSVMKPQGQSHTSFSIESQHRRYI